MFTAIALCGQTCCFKYDWLNITLCQNPLVSYGKIRNFVKTGNDSAVKRNMKVSCQVVLCTHTLVDSSMVLFNHSG